MFEFHGWVVIEVDDPDDADTAIVDACKDQGEAALRTALADATDNFCVFDVLN